jgi:nicotinate-nucleotide adenylyltransferase
MMSGASGAGSDQQDAGVAVEGKHSGRVRAGVFGGTFDPIHVGHLILLEEARFELNLDIVFLMPAADPPHKQGSAISPVEDRIRMCSLATIDATELQVSRIDADRPGPHYSVDMVRLLQRYLGPLAQIYFLMGLDSLRDLPTWYKPQELMAQCNLVALSRAGVEIDWAALEASLPGIRERVILMDMPEMEISGRDIRLRVREGRPIHYQVPRAVENYIHARGLYSSA